MDKSVAETMKAATNEAHQHKDERTKIHIFIILYFWKTIAKTNLL